MKKADRTKAIVPNAERKSALATGSRARPSPATTSAEVRERPQFPLRQGVWAAPRLFPDLGVGSGEPALTCINVVGDTGFEP
ncbi:MAG: hypothetical protein QM655_16875, partial [Nocardioidaceae bacterium]